MITTNEKLGNKKWKPLIVKKKLMHLLYLRDCVVTGI